MTTQQVLIPGAFVLAVVGALLLLQTGTSNALARCEQRPGATVAECRLIVLGR